MCVKFKAMVLPSSPMANGWYVQGLDASSIGWQDQALVVAVHHDLKERSGRRQGENPSREIGYRKICWKYGETRGKVNTQGQILGKHKNESEFNWFDVFPPKKSATPFSDSYRTRPFHGFSPCFRVKWCETLWLEWQRSKGAPIFKNLQSTAGIEINSEYSIHYNSILAMSLWTWNKNKLQLQYTWVLISESQVFIRLSVSFSRHPTITPMVLWVRPQEFW